MNGWDAVVSSLGTGLSPFREVSLPTVATRALVTAMMRNGVRRLVSISALGVGGQPSRRLRVRPAVPAFAAQPCLHKESQEAAIRASSLDLVLVRPAMLTNDPARARADVARDTWLANTSYLVVKGAENSRLICGFVAHQRRNDPV